MPTSIGSGKRNCVLPTSAEKPRVEIDSFLSSRPGRSLQRALGIESDDVINYCFPQQWPADREQRAKIIGEWLQTEARFLA